MAIDLEFRHKVSNLVLQFLCVIREGFSSPSNFMISEILKWLSAILKCFSTSFYFIYFCMSSSCLPPEDVFTLNFYIQKTALLLH
jgi:hypothetical protein